MRVRHHRTEALIGLALDISSSLGRVGRCDIAGSFRRGTETVGDLDLLVRRVVPALRILANEYGARLFSNPDKVKSQGRAQIDDLKIDLYACRLETWGSGLLATTGSRIFHRSLCRRARSMGMSLRLTGLHDMGGIVTGGTTEEELFEILDMDFVPPKNRDFHVSDYRKFSDRLRKETKWQIDG